MQTHLELQMRARREAEERLRAMRDLMSWEDEIAAKDEQVRSGKLVLTKTESNSTPVKDKSTKSSRSSSRSSGVTPPRSQKNIAISLSPSSPSSSQVEDDSKETTSQQRAFEVEKERGNLFFRAGDYEAAILSYSRCVELAPHNAIGYANRSTARYKLGEFKMAEADASLALRYARENTKYLYKRALAREALGDVTHAVVDLKRAVKLDKGFRPARVLLKKLNAKKKEDDAGVREVGEEGEEEESKRKVMRKVDSKDRQQQQQQFVQLIPITVVDDADDGDFSDSQWCVPGVEEVAEEEVVEESEDEDDEAKQPEVEEVTQQPDGDPLDDIPPPPVNPIDFEKHYRSLKHSMVRLGAWLATIPLPDIPGLLTTSLSEELLIDCVHALHAYHVPNALHATAVEFLTALTLVPRFEMTAMFLPRDAKTSVSTLLGACEAADPTLSASVGDVRSAFQVQ